MKGRIENLAAGVTLYCGDCRDILQDVTAIDSIVSDPPYGINYTISARKWRGVEEGGIARGEMTKRAAIVGDDRPFDIKPLLEFRKVALFGANHFDGLPSGGRWIIWDKRRDSKSDSHSDCELIWSNVSGADRIHRQKWRGIVREGEENLSRSRKLHPNQKPVALIDFIFDQIGIVPDLRVCDPYMGSGSTGVVAVRRGCRFVGIEIDETHFTTALKRIEAELAKNPVSA